MSFTFDICITIIFVIIIIITFLVLWNDKLFDYSHCEILCVYMCVFDGALDICYAIKIYILQTLKNFSRFVIIIQPH